MPPPPNTLPKKQIPGRPGSPGDDDEYDDWCAAQFAKALGKADDYHYFMKRAQNYKNVFDPKIGYVLKRFYVRCSY